MARLRVNTAFGVAFEPITTCTGQTQITLDTATTFAFRLDVVNLHLKDNHLGGLAVFTQTTRTANNLCAQCLRERGH
ncbi:MAG TPA: hypothetical protein VLK33_11700 [Terriglobales bacterium]|nr:hypothetical protein [Terriglobales bacterium]